MLFISRKDASDFSPGAKKLKGLFFYKKIFLCAPCELCGKYMRDISDKAPNCVKGEINPCKT